MIKLADILKETLEESNIIQVPEEILSKLEGIYDYIEKNKEILHKYSIHNKEYKDWFIAKLS